MNCSTEGRVLLVGEGNFSLSASLVASKILSGPQIVTTCLPSQASVQKAHETASDNINFLQESGAKVVFEVDARELHNHEEIKCFEFSRVIFNFPLADRHNIKKNRALLCDFFSSVLHILDPHKGKVMVTLCKGQGGTPADQPMRSWHNSWQIVSLAANAGFILSEIYPFCPQEFEGYRSVGFRFQDKGFITDSALTHVFERAKVVTPDDFDVKQRCYYQQGAQNFVVPPYIRRKFDRWSLLDQPWHPITILNRRLTKHFQMLGTVSIMHRDPGKVPEVLEGYRSSLCGPVENIRIQGVVHNEDAVGGKLEEGTSENKKCSKDLKNMQNLIFAASAAADAGGDMSVGSRINTMVTDDAESARHMVTPEVESGECTAAGSSRVFAHGFYQDLVKDAACWVKTADGEPHDHKSNLLATKMRALSSPVYVVWKAAKFHSSATSADGDEEADFERHKLADHVRLQSTGYSLFHLRISLLENLPHLAALAGGNSKTLLVTGSVFHKCPINSVNLPVSHEMVFISFASNLRADDLVNHLLSTLKDIVKKDIMAVEHAECQLTVASRGHLNAWHTLQTSDNSIMGHVFRYSQCHNAEALPGKEEEFLTLQGVGAVLYLDQIVVDATNIPDIRIVWSEDCRFQSQFENEHSDIGALTSFQPFSLYPVRFMHDISFWENPERIFDETDLLDIVRDTAGDTVTSVTLIDKFQNLETGKVSRCYRLIFQSHDQALSYITTWKLQCRIRLEVAQKLTVELR